MADTSSAFGYGALYFAKETEFATEPGGGIVTYVEVESWEATAEQAYLENEVMKQGLQQHTSGIVGHKSDSTAELVMYVHGYSTTTPVSAPDADDVHPDAQLLACALGGMFYGGYDGVGCAAGCTESVLQLTDASSFVPGQALLTNSEVGWIAEVDGNEVTLLHDLRAVPDEGDAVYGCIVVWPTDAFDDDDSPSLAFKQVGLRSDDVKKYLGCRPNSAKVEGTPKGFLKMSLGFNVCDWERADAGGDPDPETYSYPDETQIVSSRLLVQENTGAVAAMEADCSKFVLDFGLGISAKNDMNQSQGVAEWRKTATVINFEADPVQGIESTTAGWEYMYAQQYRFTIVLQVGTAAGETFSFCLPSAELVETPATVDQEGLNAKNLKFRAMAHARCTLGAYSGDSYPGNKAGMAAWA